MQPSVRARACVCLDACVVAWVQARGCTVGFVGDGVNDVLASSQADVGLLIGSKGKEGCVSEVTRSNADIIMMDTDLGAVLQVRPHPAGLLLPFSEPAGGSPLLAPLAAAAGQCERAAPDM